MAELDDIDGLAGEYVLGTLDPAERAAVAARRQREPDLDAAITAWELRFAPLMDFIAPVVPPDHVIERIMRGIDGQGIDGQGIDREGREGIAALQRRLRGWRIAAVGAGTIAACLAAFIVADGLRAWRPPQNFVAVLQKDAASPAFIVSVDIEARALTIRPVAATQPADKSYELWLVNEQLRTPRSLGVVQNAEFTVETSRLGDLPPDLVRKSILAVTLEPVGGSPSGLPTGPILYSGALVQATP